MAPAMTEAETAPILQRTQTLHLPRPAGTLSAGEEAAVRELLAAGEIMHALYLEQRHPQARAAQAYLSAPQARGDLRTLFRVMSGPIATTLENERRPILTIVPEAAGKNVYPHGATREAFDAFFAANPGRRDEILSTRAVVRNATRDAVTAALAALDRHPALETLHPGLRARLQSSEQYISVPHAVAYADDIMAVYGHLNAAAAHIEAGDPAFARYLRLRARDLLADDYEGGDAAWVTGRFTGALNAQIGAYETYDDSLFGVKAFFSLSLLQRDEDATRELARAIDGIQDIENALPYDAHKEVRSAIPVAVYNVIADFGQARGTNTATILPNEAYLARQYGRTILMRGNILRSPTLFANTEREFNAAVAAAHQGDLTLDGGFYRTLWHEIGHYLGVDQTADGRDLDVALEDNADLLEEMKADLVSLFAARMLHARGLFSDAQLRSIYASGVRRVLQKNRPRRAQPYQTMQLIQWNWFLDRGLLRFEDGALAIDYARYPDAVDSLLREVLALQRNGDRAAASAFIDRWTAWDESLHGVTAQRMRAVEQARFTLVTYEALDGPQ
ncbi:MAG: NUDIX hydrolase [Alphaproteobacteria bacterium]|nr:NUDIX hydrolase [Alphaproteobacteria bacterium]